MPCFFSLCKLFFCLPGGSLSGGQDIVKFFPASFFLSYVKDPAQPDCIERLGKLQLFVGSPRRKKRNLCLGQDGVLCLETTGKR